MIRRRATASAAVSAVAVLLAGLTGCSSTTAGTGRALPASGRSASSSTAPHPEPATSAPRSTSAAPSSPSSPVQSAPSSPVRTATVHSIAGNRTYKIDVWAETTDLDCAAHAYGTPVVSYLSAHPCSNLTRLLATTTVGGKRVGFNQSSVAFAGSAPASYQTAGGFRTLVSQNGTGNVNDLLREGRRLPAGPAAVPSPDAFSALAQDASVTIVDAWYLDRPTPDNDPALVRMAQDIYLQY